MLPLLLLAVAPPPPHPTAHGDRLRDAWLACRTARAPLPDDWPRQAPVLRRQFLDMMGLDPLPERTPLKATVVRTTDHKTFTVAALHFQSMPGLYVTANLYLPKRVNGPLPAVLYLCGHGPAVIDGVVYGNKVTYQHHAVWYAENGYACLVLDTLQLGEVPGLHHGTSRFGMWWWASLGYTPAGVELWNAMRALDYLTSRPDIDARRIGVAGRSGGGASAWFLTAADERVKCAVPVAGIADLRAHVSEGYPGRLASGVVAGHCDCMYFHNTYGWDYSHVMALCAPRPVLLGNSDADDIFPVPGYRRPAAEVAGLYKKLGAEGKFALWETKGPHSDTPALRLGEYRWMNRHLKGDKGEVHDPVRPKIDPKALKVFAAIPKDAINARVHETFRKPAIPPKASELTPERWEKESAALKKRLLDRSFRAWPEKPSPFLAAVTTKRIGGLAVSAIDAVGDEDEAVRMWFVEGEGPVKRVRLEVLDEAGWADLLASLGPEARGLIDGNPPPRPWPAKKALTVPKGEARAFVAPFGVGPTRWTERGPHDKRRFLLLGRTLDEKRIRDVRQAIRVVGERMELTVSGKGEMAGVALYASIFEPRVSAVELRGLPATHKEGPTLLNALTILDAPQAVALMSPRGVTLEGDEATWAWTTEMARATKWGGWRLVR